MTFFADEEAGLAQSVGSSLILIEAYRTNYYFIDATGHKSVVVNVSFRSCRHGSGVTHQGDCGWV